MIWFNRQSKISADKLLEVVSTYSKVIRYKVNLLEIKFLYKNKNI